MRFSSQSRVTAGIARFRTLEEETYFYQNVFASLSEGYLLLPVLQLVCCVWVTVQVYFVDFQSVKALLEFRDFNRWLLPLKGETLRDNSWVVAIPLIQYALGVAIVSISCVIICASTSGFDAVMNSLAFTFITTVAEVFNTPLLRHYASTPVHGLDPEEYGTDPIYYLVDEYDEGNAAWVLRYPRAAAANATAEAPFLRAVQEILGCEFVGHARCRTDEDVCAVVAAGDVAAALRAAGQQGLTERAERRPN